jgi:hypothetical protein
MRLACPGHGSKHDGLHRKLDARLVIFSNIGNIRSTMSAAEATAEIFVTAFKSLKRREREAVLTRMITDTELSEDLADTLVLEARRHQPRQSFRDVLKELKTRA